MTHWYDEADLQEQRQPARFALSHNSRNNLHGVHADLIAVVERAITITEVDFGVTEGLRSEARQREMVARGASQTMNSRHLTGHAVDLVAYIGSRVSWEWPLYFQIADAMRESAKQLGTPLIWGGAWGRLLTDSDNAYSAQDRYVSERRRLGRQPFLDGPHFELPREVYPA